MQYVLLIYQGSTPLPNTPEWNTLPKDEQKAIYADYAALNQDPRITGGPPLGLPENARTVRVDSPSMNAKAQTAALEARSVRGDARPESAAQRARPAPASITAASRASRRAVIPAAPVPSRGPAPAPGRGARGR